RRLADEVVAQHPLLQPSVADATDRLGHGQLPVRAGERPVSERDGSRAARRLPPRSRHSRGESAVHPDRRDPPPVAAVPDHALGKDHHRPPGPAIEGERPERDRPPARAPAPVPVHRSAASIRPGPSDSKTAARPQPTTPWPMRTQASGARSGSNVSSGPGSSTATVRTTSGAAAGSVVTVRQRTWRGNTTLPAPGI